MNGAGRFELYGVIALIFPQWGRCRRAAVSDRAVVSGGCTVDMAAKNFAQPS